MKTSLSFTLYILPTFSNIAYFLVNAFASSKVIGLSKLKYITGDIISTKNTTAKNAVIIIPIMNIMKNTLSKGEAVPFFIILNFNTTLYAE